MSLFIRLKCFKLNFVPKLCYHSLIKVPQNSPPVGARSLWKILRKPTKTDLKVADDVPDAFELIYRNTMSKYLLGAQIVSVITGGMVLMAYLFRTDYPEFRKRSLEWSDAARPTEHEEIYYFSVFVLILALMQVMIVRTPIRIYKKPQSDKYVAVSYGNYIFGKERYSFRRGEISHLPEKGILPWRSNRFLIQRENFRRNVLLVDHYFRRPADLSIMLGEQKDPDLDNEERGK